MTSEDEDASLPSNDNPQEYSMPYHKELYVFDQLKPVRAVVRGYRAQDFAELITIQSECFPPPFPQELWWNQEQLSNHVRLFPLGALCVEIGGQLVGSMTGLCIRYPAHGHLSWEQATDGGYIRNHDPQGDTLYVVDVSVRPAFRKLGLGKQLMQSLYEVVIHLRLTRLLGGGRMSGYHLHAEKLSPEQYLDAVVRGELNDPVISFMLKCGRVPVGVVHNYLEDEESRHSAALMEWRNPFLPTA